MENPETGKKNSSRQTPVWLIYFYVFLAVVASCLSFAFSVYSFKQVSSLDKEFHSRPELNLLRSDETLDSSDSNMEVGKVKPNERAERKPRSGPQTPPSNSCPPIVVQGVKGDRGERGRTGATGPPGPPGAPGMLIGESIHLVGKEGKDGKGKKQIQYDVTNWEVSHRVGRMVYHNAKGTVEIKREGYYFIYSQMYYYDGSTVQMAHNTFINDDLVMESRASVINQTRKDNTKFHGGVFLLRVNDTISVRMPFSGKTYFMNREKSFFGAFLIHTTGSPGSVRAI